MAKIFSTSGTGASQVLNEADNNKLKVYDDFEDIDKTALADGEIVSTKEDVAGGNVYDYVEEQIADVKSLLDCGPDYANGVTTQLSTTQGGTSTGTLTTTFTATEDCYIVARHYTLNAGSVDVATSLQIFYGTDTTFGTEIYRTQLPSVYGAGVANPPIRLSAGETITIVYSGYSGYGYCKNYTVYPVKRGN
jgi:hypothetical protein